jgi:hypothetical protein
MTSVTEKTPSLVTQAAMQEARQMSSNINYEFIFNELIRSVKHITQNPDLYDNYSAAMPTLSLIKEIHTVGLKSGRQTGLTTSVKSFVVKNNEACVLSDMPIVYDGVNCINPIYEIPSQLADRQYTIFFIDIVLNKNPSIKDIFFSKLYEIVGKDLVIVEV